MVQAPSITGDPEGYRAMASIISKEMESLGFQTKWLGVNADKPNVVGILNPGKEPLLLFNGHMDVVPPGSPETWGRDPFAGQQEGDRFYGRGACDMKGGLVAMILGAKMFLETSPIIRGGIILTATVDEEIGGFDGLKYLMDQGLKANFGVVCEPTDLNIVNVSKGLVWISLKTKGREAHGSMPEMGINAISKMAQLLIKLEEDPPCSGIHPILGHSSINVGAIHAGTKPNIVPGACEAQIDVRYLPGQTPEEVLNKIEEVIDQFKTKDPHLQAHVEMMRFRMPVEIPENSEIIIEIRRAIEKVTGIPAQLRGMVSPGDLEHLIRAGIPSVMVGPGSETLAHSANEWISIDSILMGASIYANLLFEVLT